ncbi:MAG: WD40 repeat domain-containing protein [Phycisphaerae bacterium]|jgi:WD40 repeat protein|nr:WD40 repeat domain-containing protein [Phycisphaerae bacterium]
MIFELLKDFSTTVAVIPAKHAKHRMLGLLEETVRRDIHFLDRHPTALHQYMRDNCDRSDDSQEQNRLCASSGIEEEHSELVRSRTHTLSALVEVWRKEKNATTPEPLLLFSRRRPVSKSPHPEAASPDGGFELVQVIPVDGIRSLSVDRRWKLAIAGGNDGVLYVWDLETGGLNWRIDGHTDPITGIALTPDGKRAVSVSEDGVIKVWDIRHAAELMMIEPQAGPLSSVALTDGGHWCYCGAANGAITRWALQGGWNAGVMTGHSNTVCALAVCGPGLISASWDGTLRLWNAHNNAQAVLSGPKAGISGVSVGSPACSRVVASSFDGSLTVWNLDVLKKEKALTGHNEEVMSVAATFDASIALSGSVHGIMKVWNTETGECLQTFHGHSLAVLAIRMSPDGSLAASCSADKSLRIWKSRKSWSKRT